jgi:hypothetical protein
MITRINVVVETEDSSRSTADSAGLVWLEVEMLGVEECEAGGLSLGPWGGPTGSEVGSAAVVAERGVELAGPRDGEVGGLVGGGSGLVGGGVGCEVPSSPPTTEVRAFVVCPTVVRRPETVPVSVLSRLPSSSVSRFPLADWVVALFGAVPVDDGCGDVECCVDCRAVLADAGVAKLARIMAKSAVSVARAARIRPHGAVNRAGLTTSPSRSRVQIQP